MKRKIIEAVAEKINKIIRESNGTLTINKIGFKKLFNSKYGSTYCG